MVSVQEKRLLVVGGNDWESETIVQIVKCLGYEGRSTWSAKDALAYLTADRFSLVIVDDHILDMYVGEFIDRALRLPNCPTIALMKTKKTRPIRYDRSRGKCRVFDKDRLDKLFEVLQTQMPEFNGSQIS